MWFNFGTIDLRRAYPGGDIWVEKLYNLLDK
jgi:hypothetical protein